MPAERRVQAQAEQASTLKLFPQIRPSRKYNRPTYASDLGWLTIGKQQNHWLVWTCSPAKIEDYLKRHPPIKHGKGCLNFKRQDTLDPAALVLVIRKAPTAESTQKKITSRDEHCA